MRRIKLTVEYDGSAYSGWQIQKGQDTIQAQIEEALQRIFRQPIRITAAGRTDSGVHARNQIVHLDIPEYNLNRLQHSLNGILNKDIVIKDAETVHSQFHARYDARERCYRYYISQTPVAIGRSNVWVVSYPLNLTIMQRAAELLLDHEDFQAFCKVRSEVDHYRCTLFRSFWMKENKLLVYEIAGNRFLHGMVRAIVGTLIEVGRGKMSLTEMRHIIDKRDRRLVPATAPARGLTLEEIIY